MEEDYPRNLLEFEQRFATEEIQPSDIGLTGKLFFRLMENAVQVAPAPYKDLVKHVSPGPDHNQ